MQLSKRHCPSVGLSVTLELSCSSRNAKKRLFMMLQLVLFVCDCVGGGLGGCGWGLDAPAHPSATILWPRVTCFIPCSQQIPFYLVSYLFHPVGIFFFPLRFFCFPFFHLLFPIFVSLLLDYDYKRDQRRNSNRRNRKEKKIHRTEKQTEWRHLFVPFHFLPDDISAFLSFFQSRTRDSIRGFVRPSVRRSSWEVWKRTFVTI